MDTASCVLLLPPFLNPPFHFGDYGSRIRDSYACRSHERTQTQVHTRSSFPREGSLNLSPSTKWGSAKGTPTKQTPKGHF